MVFFCPNKDILIKNAKIVDYPGNAVTNIQNLTGKAPTNIDSHGFSAVVGVIMYKIKMIQNKKVIYVVY